MQRIKAKMLLFLKKRRALRIKPLGNLLQLVKPAVALKIQSLARGYMARRSLPFRRYLKRLRYS
jgi:hypothetical protein